MKEALSHRQLQSLIQVSNVLNSSLDIDTIIHSIMVQTVSVIDAAHGGVLFLYDSKQDCLVARSDNNFKTDVLSTVRLKAGESMTGLAFEARKCLIFPNRTEVKKATATLSEENLRLMLESIPTLPFSSICAPIFIKEECIGVITLDSFNPDLQFFPEDINLLMAISDQAAVALEKASLYKEKDESIRQLELLNKTISKQNEMLSRSVDIHNSLAELVLNGEGLDSIIQYIHKSISQQVLLFDDLGELVSSVFHTPVQESELNILRIYALEILEKKEIYRSRAEVHIGGSKYRLAALPVGTKPQFLGVLLIVSDGEMSDVDIGALEHACSVISLEMVKERAIYESHERMNADLIESLYSGNMDETIIQQAKHLQFSSEGYYMALILQLDEADNIPNKNSIIRHLVQMGNRVFLKHHVHGVAIQHHEQIIVLLSFQQKVSTKFVESQVKELVSNFQEEVHRKSWGTTVSIGIGRIHSGLTRISKSFHEAVKCLQFIQGFGQKNKLVSYKDLGVQRLLLQNSEEELIDFIREVLGPVMEYDVSRKGELLPSLFAYLEHNQNAKEAAEAIHVHTNTLTYRLKRIEELLSTDLNSSSSFLNIHLAASLYPFFKNKLTFTKKA